MLDCRKSGDSRQRQAELKPENGTESDLREQGRAKKNQPWLIRGPVTTGAEGPPGQWSIEQETLIPVFLYYYLFMAVEADGDHMWEATEADTWDSLGLHPTHSRVPCLRDQSRVLLILALNRTGWSSALKSDSSPRHGVTQRKPSALCCALELGVQV